jgi:hypothetical protein
MRLLLLFLFVYSFSHPLNNTLMKLNLNKNSFYVSFISFNFNKVDTTNSSQDIKKRIANYIEKNIKIDNCKLLNPQVLIHRGVYTKIYFDTKCNGLYNIDYNLFFKYDKTHQGILEVIDGKKGYVAKFDYNHRTFEFKKKTLSTFEVIKKFIVTGIFHILEGIDHIFFLLMLIIPSALYANSFKKLFIEILKIVTAFTLSHSITLSLSMFNIVYIPERIIETSIALTIFFTALLNLQEFIKIKTWKLAFLFGFVHGFGFANSLKDLHLNIDNLVTVVFSFNSGVEIGQIIIVSIMLPVIYGLSKANYNLYKKVIILTSSLTLILSLLWAIDRWFMLHFMPF